MEKTKTLIELLAGYAETQPDIYFAADSNGVSLTYREAWHEIKHVAKNLTELYSIKQGDKVLIRCNQSVNYLVIYLACNLINAIFVPVEESASDERIRDIAEETECKLYINTFRDESFCSCVLYEELFAANIPLSAFTFPDSDDIAEILYTTGTTGKSKGIVMTHRANIALAENVKYGVVMREHNVELIPLVMSHSHGLRTFYANLLNGGTVVITNGVMNVRAVFNLMDTFKVTALDISPSAAQILIKLSKGEFWNKARHLDYIEIGTAALPELLKEQLSKNLPGVRLYNSYGSTESGRTCALDFSVDGTKRNCIGKPTKNAELVFTDDDRNPIHATPENPGLLASRGPMNMMCYWKNPSLTKEILINGFICTNDLGYFDENGNAYVVGRRDDVINYNGIKISPIEIEEVIALYPPISECACIGITDSVAGQIPKLFIVPKDNKAFDMENFQSFLSSHLDRTKMPKIVEMVETLPKTYNGKLDRKALKLL